MRDPYQVLGVSKDTSEQDIKKAYRKLCKQYHPDLNPDTPSAQAKFQEVQTAYEMISNGTVDTAAGNTASGSYGGYRQQGSSENPFGGFTFWGFDFEDLFFGGSTYQRQAQQRQTGENQYMQAARNYINAHRYREALTVLNSVEERNAKWYYYSAVAYAGTGNKSAANQFARTAAQMEPGNYDYQQFANQMAGGGAYSSGSAPRSSASPLSFLGKLVVGYFILQFLLMLLRFIFRF